MTFFLDRFKKNAQPHIPLVLDEVTFNGKHLFLCFPATGNTGYPSVINIDAAQKTTIETQGVNLVVSGQGVIESFASEERARGARLMVWNALTQNSGSLPRARNKGKLATTCAVVVAGFVGFGLLLSMIPAPTAIANSGQELMKLSDRTALPVTSQDNATPPVPEQRITNNADRLAASGFKPGEKPLDFSVKMGNGKRVIYVFSDPKCPACRQTEPILEAAAKTFTVYLFPVAFQPGSDLLAQKVLCSENREKAWKELQAGKIPSAPESCAAASGVDKLSKLMIEQGMAGTPTIVSDDGRYRTGVGSVEELTAWANKTTKE